VDAGYDEVTRGSKTPPSSHCQRVQIYITTIRNYNSEYPWLSRKEKVCFIPAKIAIVPITIIVNPYLHVD
jgi:hypothetical protein